MYYIHNCFTRKNSLNVTAYLSLQTYLDCFVFTELASDSSVIFLSFVCEESTKNRQSYLAHPQVVCANKETENKTRNEEYKKEIAV